MCETQSLELRQLLSLFQRHCYLRHSLYSADGGQQLLAFESMLRDIRIVVIAEFRIHDQLNAGIMHLNTLEISQQRKLGLMELQGGQIAKPARDDGRSGRLLPCKHGLQGT